MEVQVSLDVWAGIDAGKASHHCVVIDQDGAKLLSRKVTNDEAELVRLIDDVAGLAVGGHIQWAIDLNAGCAALLIALLVARKQDLVYIPGRTVHHASAAYRGAGKTDAKDAAVIADQARMRRDLLPFRQRDEITTDLKLLLRATNRSRYGSQPRAGATAGHAAGVFPSIGARFQLRTPPRSLDTSDALSDTDSDPTGGVQQDQCVAAPARCLPSRRHR